MLLKILNAIAAVIYRIVCDASQAKIRTVEGSFYRAK